MAVHRDVMLQTKDQCIGADGQCTDHRDVDVVKRRSLKLLYCYVFLVNSRNFTHRRDKCIKYMTRKEENE